MPTLDYVAVTVTLAAKDTNYRLLDLIRAIEPDAPATSTQLNLQSDTENGAAKIYVGDEKMSGTRRGYTLQVGDPSGYNRPINSVLLACLNVRSDTDGAKLNVEVMLS